LAIPVQLLERAGNGEYSTSSEADAQLSGFALKVLVNYNETLCRSQGKIAKENPELRL